ncbi:MAG: family 43 glycosylhydrolase [Segetibacter sp.]
MHLFKFNPEHKWENQGAFNEYTNVCWMEAPYMTKHNGTYYLQYSAPGTDWKTYAVGVYRSKSPLGSFKYDETSPILKSRGGLIYGTGHHCMINAPDGSLWCVYTLLYNNWSTFERRIAMDPVTFDKAEHMVVNGPSEMPQKAPGTNKDLANNGTGSLPLSVDKVNVNASSSKPGRHPKYAIDDYLRTR